LVLLIPDFQLIQILAVSDGLTTDEMSEPAIVSASFADPFVLVVLDNGSVIVYRCDEQTLELEAITVSEYVKVGCSFYRIADAYQL
jgi:hypothetical protein